MALAARFDERLYRSVAPKFGDCRHQTTSMPHCCNAKVFQIVRSQLTQYVSVDFILTECGLVLGETQVPEPIRDAHRRFLQPGEA